ncbi:hypothetical protein C5167_018391 [Papaver somniferum]|uniref:Acyl-ACP thioesterase-like C-terminal domain-containing protein n=1 Tax=Papaver somniferum TaxID=3469 RepID=A0A4Y7IM46_PAPSO|nr:hypothetical protein C5167_018391 [Papaver somniferum]
MPEEVRDEMAPHTMDYRIRENIKLSKLHDNASDFVQARWSDLDVNHHVNFSKYIDWILESGLGLFLKVKDNISNAFTQCSYDNLRKSGAL